MRTPRRGSSSSADRVARRAVYTTAISCMTWQEHRRTRYLRWANPTDSGPVRLVCRRKSSKRPGHLDRLTYQRLGAIELEEVAS